MTLTEQEAAKVIEALESRHHTVGCTNHHEGSAPCSCIRGQALDILQVAKDRPQPAVDINLVDGMRERWEQLRNRGEYGPHPATEDPWRSFCTGWAEGRAPLLKMMLEHAELFGEVRNALTEYRDADTKAFDPESPNGRLMQAVCVEVMRQTNRGKCLTQPAVDRLIGLVEWCADDADYKAPEQFTKGYVFGRYLYPLLQAAQAAKSAAPVAEKGNVMDWFDVAYGEKAERLHMGYANPVVQGLFTAFLAGVNRATLGDTGGSDLKRYAAPVAAPKVDVDAIMDIVEDAVNDMDDLRLGRRETVSMNDYRARLTKLFSADTK